MIDRFIRKRGKNHNEMLFELNQTQARLEQRAKQADASSDADFVVAVADEIFASLRDLLPRAEDPAVSGALVDRTRWIVLLASKLPRPPWQHIAMCGLLYAGSHTLNLDRATLKLQNADWSEEQRQEFLEIVLSMMSSGRSVLSITAYSWHRFGVPGLIGQLLETGSGTLFGTDQHVTIIKSVTSDPREQEKLARSHFKHLRKLRREDLPANHFLSTVEANALNEKYFVRQIAAVRALPAHVRLLAADLKNCTPQMAAITTGRDVIYLVITFRGSCAIRYTSDHTSAGKTLSIEIESLTSKQSRRWINDAANAYKQFNEKLIDERSLSRTVQRILTAIGDHVLTPILESWPDLKRFTIIPSEGAAALPLFSALIDGTPACTAYDFTVSPSARALYSAAQFAAAAPTSALVAADPSEGDLEIPFTTVEAARIAQLYDANVVGPRRSTSPQSSRGRSLRMIDADTTSSLPDMQPLAAWRELDAGIGRPVVHFACHGQVTDFPDPDARLLIGDGVSLGDFMGESARPISPGGVVVLSACSVGGIAAAAPSELIGFPTVMLGAGVRNLIAPMWPVLDGDPTVELMVDFHRFLRAGVQPNIALGNAVRAAIEAGAPCSVWGVYSSFGC